MTPRQGPKKRRHGDGWGSTSEPVEGASVARAAAKKTRETWVQNVRYEPRTARRTHLLRATPTEIEALDLLVLRWGANRSTIVRSLIVGATLGELDRLDALDAADPRFDALVDVPSIDDVLAAP